MEAHHHLLTESGNFAINDREPSKGDNWDVTWCSLCSTLSGAKVG